MGLNTADSPDSSTTGFGALRGGLGFLTRIPVGRCEEDWSAFRASPVTFPLVGYVVGALLVLPLAATALVPLPAPTVAITFLVWLYAVTGINHLDGLADLGDAMAVHGDAERRLTVLSDTTVGVGALLAVGVVLAGIALAGLAFTSLPLRLIGVVVAAEVGAKLGMATLACVGTAATDGLGAELTQRARPASLVIPVVVALPAVALTWPSPAAGIALLAPVVVALVLWRWARRNLGGVNGDVLGAANEIGRLAGLHAGVIAWTLS